MAILDSVLRQRRTRRDYTHPHSQISICNSLSSIHCIAFTFTERGGRSADSILDIP